MVMRYVKKPVSVLAMQFTGDEQNLKDAISWVGEENCYTIGDELYIKTLEGDMKCSVSNYIIQGVNGEFYPCREDIFKRTYDLDTK